MKRSFITLYALAATALTAVAQPRFTSNTETYDFGQIEWKHPVTVQYSITNTGNQPLVLTDVEPDCACSVARWTKTPIAPGAKGVVDVTFDAEALGHFNKSVAIYSNAQPHLVYLKFNGEVVQEIKDFTKTHPYLIGQIRIDKNSLDFPDVQAGEKPVVHIGVVNLSDRPYEPVLMHLPPYLQTEVKPNVLQKGEKGVITVTLDSERLTDFGLTQASVYLARFSGDKVGDFCHSVTRFFRHDRGGKGKCSRCQSFHKGHRYECRIGKEIKGTSGYYHNQYRTFSFTNQ